MSRSSIAGWPLLLMWVFLAAPLQAEDWPHWRGMNRNDIVGEISGWKSGQSWPGPEQWSVNVGEGSTSPIVIDRKLYTLGWRDGQDRLVCLDASSGEELWQVDYACPRHGRKKTGDEGLYAGPTATPEFDEKTGLLYTLSTDGDLHAWDTNAHGKRVWHRNLYDDFDVPQRPKVTRGGGLRDYGYTTAPLLYRDLLLVEVGAKQGNLIAFDKRTGKLLWNSTNNDPAGHTGGPVPMVVDGVDCVAVLTLFQLVVTRLDGDLAGRTIAEYEWKTDFGNSIASPAVHGASVLVTSNYNRNAIARIEISLQGAKLRWERPFPSKVCTPIIHDGKVYWSWRQVRCLDFETGKENWAGGDFGDAGSCILTADDRLIVWGRTGRLVLAETAKRAPESYVELARKDGLFRTDVWPHVVLANGRLFCKDWRGNLKCFSINRPIDLKN